MSKGKEMVLSYARGLWGPGGCPGTDQPSSLMGLTADIPLRHCHIQMRLEIIKCLSSNRASEDGQPPACPLWVQASSSTAGKVLASGEGKSFWVFLNRWKLMRCSSICLAIVIPLSGFSGDAAPVLKVPAPFLQPGGIISPHCPALWCAKLRKEGPFRRKYCFHLLMYSTHIRQSSCLYSGRSSPIFVINTLQSQH